MKQNTVQMPATKFVLLVFLAGLLLASCDSTKRLDEQIFYEGPG